MFTFASFFFAFFAFRTWFILFLSFVFDIFRRQMSIRNCSWITIYLIVLQAALAAALLDKFYYLLFVHLFRILVSWAENCDFIRQLPIVHRKFWFCFVFPRQATTAFRQLIFVDYTVVIFVVIITDWRSGWTWKFSAKKLLRMQKKKKIFIVFTSRIIPWMCLVILFGLKFVLMFFFFFC